MLKAPDSPAVHPVDDRRWGSVLTALRADALDCLQTTFALITDHAHGPGTHLALGAQWGLPSPVPSLDVRLAQARDMLGLVPVKRRRNLAGQALRRVAMPGRYLYVIADAYHLPWLPYAGRQHMEHSFLIDSAADAHSDAFVVVDPYHNDTPWGPARPGAWEVTSARIDAAMAGAAALTVAPGSPPRLNVPAVLASNAAGLQAEAVQQYMAGARSMASQAGALERLVLDIWVACRERLLHAVWLASLHRPPASAPEMAQLAEDWQRLAARSYIAVRRVSSGRAADAGLADELAMLLNRDVEMANQLAAEADTAVQVPEHVRDAVVEALSTVLGLDPHTVKSAPTLRALPGFESFRLVEAIELAERKLDAEAAVERAGSSGLRDLDGLCRIFAAEGPR
jgi:hypothetical protein